MPAEFSLLLVAALAATGLVAGVLAGLLGVGGGIVIVPVLFYIFTAMQVDPGVIMHLAVGTSLATIIPTSIRSVMSHHKKGSVDPALLRKWALPMLVGVLLGTAFASVVSSAALTLVFATIALIVSLHMALGKVERTLADELPSGPAGGAVAGGIGAFSAMMGIGGGTLGVPILTLFSYPIHKAVGTAAGFGLIISVPGAIGFVLAGLGDPSRPEGLLAVGYVSLLAFVLIVPATVLATPYGVKLAHVLSKTALRRAFAVFLGFTAIRMFASLV
ncbi:sulfite exporter TauE/SafE family protein [Oceanibium sediminis]|uniref:sulfite exporter TauE/SafE family protein n=1 Tax=Oceanibium sediminis TaxID=2026339 RepID=UPI000DD37849|nr:sulfite exporter TauE/SafE family protein [Oceanibium sediminis]